MKKSISYSLSFVILFFTLLSLSSCKDEKDDVELVISCENSVEDIIQVNTILSQSNWEWIESRTQGRNGEIVRTPQTEGKTMSLIFNLGQSVEELENEQVKGVWEYRINTSNDTTLGTFSSVWIDGSGNIDRTYYLDACPEVLKLTDASSSLMTVTTYRKK